MEWPKLTPDPHPNPKLEELGFKLAAHLFMIGSTHNNIIPVVSKDEWIGINLLHRDNELGAILKNLNLSVPWVYKKA